MDKCLMFAYKMNMLRAIATVPSTSNYSIALQANRGVTTNLFFELAKASGFTKDMLASFLGVSLKTLTRNAQEDKVLSSSLSEHVLKIKSLYAKGDEVFGSIKHFEQWLQKPSMGLGDITPVELMPTITGLDLIMDELVRIEFGDLA